MKRAVSASIERLRQHAIFDPMNRGISHLAPHVSDQFGSAATALRTSFTSTPLPPAVLILTGFGCMIDFYPPTETDGLLGSLCLADSLRHLGYRVAVVVDPPHHNVITAGVGAWNSTLSTPQTAQNPIYHHLFKHTDNPQQQALDLLEDTTTIFGKPHPVAAIIAIERAGMASDGKYYTMRGIAMPNVEKLDCLFTEAQKKNENAPNHLITTIGIGDGGNELGVGALAPHVRKHIPNGEKIACVVSAEHTIVAGISDWGAFALAAAIHVTEEGPANKNNLWEMPNTYAMRRVLSCMNETGAREAFSKKPVALVDGISWEMYSNVANEMGNVLKQSALQ